MSKTKTPDRETVFVYLDELRESGETNMYGAGPYLVARFGVTKDESHDLLKAWMDSFAERHA